MMKIVIVLLIIFCAQTSFAELAYFDLVSIDKLTLVSRTDKYVLAESGEIRNKKGQSVPLGKIKMPATVKADVIRGTHNENIILWVELIDAKNNLQIPE